MLGSSSSASRAMRDRKGTTSPAMDAINSRRADSVRNRRDSADGAKLRQLASQDSKESKTARVRADRQQTSEMLVERKNSRRVIQLLENIASSSKGSRGLGGLLGTFLSFGGAKLLHKMIAGSVIGKLAGALGKSSRFAAIGGDLAKILGLGDGLRVRGGKWRDMAGRFVKAPTSRIAKVAGKFLGGIAESGVGRFAAKVASNPLGRLAGKGLGAVGRIAGKFAVPLTAGLAVFDGVNGMMNADKIMGRPTTLQEKAKVGIAKAINGILLGLPDWISKKLFGMDFAHIVVGGFGVVKDTLVTRTKEAIQSVQTFVGDGIGKITSVISDAFTGFTGYIKEVQTAGASLVAAVKSGDLGAITKALGALGSLVAKGVVTPVKAVANATTKVATYTAEKTVQVATAVADTARSTVGKVAAWAGLGSVSAKYESGNRGVHAISSGKGDPGGASYGKYQLSSKQGTLQKYLKSSGYAAAFKGLAPGSTEFNAKWKELATSDPKFAESQHEFIKRTHYDPAAAHAAKLGFNMNNRGVQDAVWSASVQHGGVNKILSQAANTPGWAQMSDEDKLKRFYQVRSNYATTQMARTGASQSQIAGVAKRYTTEVNDAVMLSKQSAGGNNIAINSTMAGAKAAASTVKAAPQPTPLSEDLPAKPAPTVTTPPVATNQQTQTKAAPATKAPLSPTSSGSNGLPTVNDIADRPRIDLQAISTTLYQR